MFTVGEEGALVNQTARRYPVGLGLLLLWSAACESYRVAGGAMEPTLKDGERVTVTREIQSIERGDIVHLKYPLDESKTFIKRVVGLPGEQIAEKIRYPKADDESIV